MDLWIIDDGYWNPWSMANGINGTVDKMVRSTMIPESGNGQLSNMVGNCRVNCQSGNVGSIVRHCRMCSLAVFSHSDVPPGSSANSQME